ncbi:serine/threonine protein kinase [Streptomyces sp. ID38640]|uniref:serine/threonine-protein kinase n=1 Tax=Streptomyces sp. ID38640 TaxID=1265399 RepID=UPI00140ED814|nr:serine/threonine-protein kinase [Streptomyces sp. ID38640]QIK07934.1 serine/threonine protein kinase [Streptomyces sp. ID38640]
MDGLRGLTADDPQWIGDYRLLSRLGSGGMGRVYLARSEGGRTVAVKLVKAELAAEEEFRDRFRAEVAAARRVGGRWTAPVLDADTEAAVPWVATGYIAGPTLSEVVGSYSRSGSYGPLPEDSLRRLAYGLSCALRDIHGVGLVHRDLKPSNVLLTIDGPRVIDFGIARALDAVGEQTQTRAGTVLGSPSFMSPEQVTGQRVAPASDVFCVGSVLAYAATGRQPFGNPASGVHAVMFKIAQEEPDVAAVPDGIRALILDCLAKDPAARPTPEELAERLGPVPGGGPSAPPWLPAELIARLGQHAVLLLDTDTPPGGQPPTVLTTKTLPSPAPPPPPTAAERRRRRRWLPLVATAVVAAATAAGAVPLLSGGADADDSASDIPARYVGTWSGPVLRDGTPTGQQRRFVITHGTVGEVVANSTSLGATYECRSDGKLVSVTRQDGHPALRLDTKVVRSVPAGRCSALGEHTLEEGGADTLTWAAAGRTATLHRVAPADGTVPSGFLGTWRRPNDDGYGSQQLTVKQAPAGSTVLSTVVVGRAGRCTAHADLYAAEGGKLTVGPSVVDRAAPGCTPSSTSVLSLAGDGTLHREFLGDDKQPRGYSRVK